VAPNGYSMLESFGQSSTEVKTLHFLPHSRARHDRRKSELIKGEGEDRQYHVTDYIEPFPQPVASLAGVAHPLDRQPAKMDREEEDQQLSQPEYGHCVAAEDHQHHTGPVPRRGLSQGQLPQPDPHQAREKDRRHHQEKRGRESIKDDCENRSFELI
jgi:hypothetical protein